VQYACTGFRRVLQQHGCVQSMSRKGNCWDNAVAESFFKTLKMELVYLRTFNTRSQAKREVLEYIEEYYNWRRRHATLNYQTSVAFEQLQKAA
jgi:putative transposase